MPLRLVPLALLLGTSSALAFDTSKLGQWGSLPLDDLTPVIAKSAELQQEINKALSESNKKQGDVMCVGMRFPGQWKKSWRPSSVTLYQTAETLTHPRHHPRLSMAPTSHWTTIHFCNRCPGGAARSMSQGLRVLVLHL
jgi:hypothetical protein